jgi:PadR family transcriptional regulator PadR
MMKPTGKAEAPAPEFEHQDLLAGFVRLHVLHHAAEDGVYGHWMIQELAEHGYRLSAGTLYPMLHGMERRGYLISSVERRGRTQRRVYHITQLGREALQTARDKLRELFDEMLERRTGDGSSPTQRR